MVEGPRDWVGSGTFLYDEIRQLRAARGDIIVSIGGATGSPLANVCESASTLSEQYKLIIDTTGANYLDFDVEGGALTDAAAIDRRNRALLVLLSDSAYSHVRVSYTLPVLPQGLTLHGEALMQNTVANGVSVEVWNVMTMDYGDSAADPTISMGIHGINAISSLHQQILTAYASSNLTSSDAWRLVGTTPMIGQNDVTTEVFTLTDAHMTKSFSTAQQIGAIRMWSLNRDHPCADSHVSLTCSSVSAQSVHYEFSSVFMS